MHAMNNYHDLDVCRSVLSFRGSLRGTRSRRRGNLSGMLRSTDFDAGRIVVGIGKNMRLSLPGVENKQ